MSNQTLERIDVNSDQALTTWAEKLNVTSQQIRDAVAAVGDHPEDVELYLKGSRASTNSDQVKLPLGASS
ncbi:DUF3606 domain-containing protein [Aquabacterium sp. CECT 9606]|uniref:DUF3606 domain-containing protein n=1 Tax=Aquabacterium sp. CECT 9606 TaxID=2845822 RepID=UPI001E540672|nr:DUF3606 domain-containing protein [Aquabacterium sp. CECT 9606]CAH0348215.1 hypothetical protein AQB9606_00437 [Aquabacterium sp. CECT 9606]